MLRLLGMPLFTVLPNSTDEASFFNKALMQTATNVCNSYPMFKSRSGRIVNRSKIALGTDEVTKLFPQEIAEPFMAGRYWIKPCEAGSRAECFLRDVGVLYFDREGFLRRVFAEEYWVTAASFWKNRMINGSGNSIYSALSRSLITLSK